MKKILLIITLLTITISYTFAYNPTKQEIKLVETINQKTKEKAKSKWQAWLAKETYSLEKTNNKIKDERINFLLTKIINFRKELINELVEQNKKEVGENTKKIQEEKILKQKNEEEYIKKWKIFFEMYGTGITTDLKVSEKCTTYFDYINDIAKENDFPTELIIATWSIEYNCNLSNPNNWYWPFQISSKYYEPWEITLEQFKVSIIDYINFSKWKWQYFNENKYHNYKERFWTENINITYNNYTIRDLKLNSLLFNWIREDTTLDWNTFANWNINNQVVTNFDWLVTRFLKILNRRNNKTIN